MTLLDFLKSQLLIEQARLKARTVIWGDLAEKYCADDRAVVAEIERQINQISGPTEEWKKMRDDYFSMDEDEMI